MREKMEEKMAAQQRQFDAELNALRSQMNPHFVHNSLNAIQYYIQRNEVEVSEDYLTKFSKLMRQFFEYSRSKSLSLEDEIFFINNYLQIEKLRFEDQLQYDIYMDDDLATDELMIPTMILQPILENAVNHGIFHKQGVGRIEVRFESLGEDEFKVIITDDGIGLNQSKQLSQEQQGQTKAHSSAVISERLEILNESRDWEISYDISDRADLNEGQGTRVCITFKNLIP